MAEPWGVPPCSSEAESLGESDDDAASVRARPREPGLIQKTGPRGGLHNRSQLYRGGDPS